MSQWNDILKFNLGFQNGDTRKDVLGMLRNEKCSGICAIDEQFTGIIPCSIDEVGVTIE